MKKDFSLSEALPLMQEILESGGEVSFTPSGISMLPLLRHKKDKIFLKKPEGRLKKYDVPLYRREDGSFVLHRVVGINDDGYIMCGDNQTVKEYSVKHEAVIAVMTAFCRNGRQTDCTKLSYRFYSRIRVATLPIRSVFRRIRSLLGRIRRRLLKTNNSDKK